jgi:hypothetical protein
VPETVPAELFPPARVGRFLEERATVLVRELARVRVLALLFAGALVGEEGVPAESRLETAADAGDEERLPLRRGTEIEAEC